MAATTEDMIIFDAVCDIELKKSLSLIKTSSGCCSFKTKRQINADTQKLKQILKTIYKNVKLPRVYWKDRNNVLTIDEHYIPLQLASADTSLPLCQIFSSAKRILLEAQPGQGKTTLAWKLMYDWAKDADYMRNFQLAFFLPLHLLKKMHNMDITTAISNYYFIEDPKYLRKILKQNPATLFVLDGLDKLSDVEKKTILHVVNRTTFLDATVIVTNRTDSSQFSQQAITENFEKQVRITGVMEDDRKNFIAKFVDQINAEVVVNSVESLIKPVSEIFKWPLPMLMLVKKLSHSHHIGEYMNWTLTDMFKSLVNYLSKMALLDEGFTLNGHLDVFRQCDITPATKLRENIVQFGRLCSLQLMEREEFFKESTIIGQMYNYGLLNYNKSDLNGHYKIPNWSLLEFMVAIYLWSDFHANDFTFSEESLTLVNKIVINIGEKCLVVPFLVGLLKEKAVVLFEQLLPFAHLYSSQEILLWRILVEYKCNYDFFKVVDFMPVNAHKKSSESLSKFYSSTTHSKLISSGIENGRLNGIFISSDLSFNLPQNAVIPVVYIDNNCDYSKNPLHNHLTTLSRHVKKLSNLHKLAVQSATPPENKFNEAEKKKSVTGLALTLNEVRKYLNQINKNNSRFYQIVRNTLKNTKEVLSLFSTDNEFAEVIKLINDVLKIFELTSIPEFGSLTCKNVIWTWTENITDNEEILEQMWSFHTSIKSSKRGVMFNNINCVNSISSSDTDISSLNYEVITYNSNDSTVLCNLLQNRKIETLSLTLLNESAVQIIHDVSPHLITLKSLHITNNSRNKLDDDSFQDKITFPLPRKAKWHSLVLFDIKLKHQQIGLRVYHLCIRNSEPETVKAVGSIDITLLQCTADLLHKLHLLDSNWPGYESVIELGLMLDGHKVAADDVLWQNLSCFKNLEFLEIAFPGPKLSPVEDIAKCFTSLPISYLLLSYVEWDLDLLDKLVSYLKQSVSNNGSSFSHTLESVSIMTHLNGQETNQVLVFREIFNSLLQFLKDGQFNSLEVICSKLSFWPAFLQNEMIDHSVYNIQHTLWGTNEDDPKMYKLLYREFHAMYNKFSITLRDIDE